MVKILLYLLLFFLPTQLGKHFWFDFSSKLGRRVDYLAPTIYFTDLIIALILVVFGIKHWKAQNSKLKTQSDPERTSSKFNGAGSLKLKAFFNDLLFERSGAKSRTKNDCFSSPPTFVGVARRIKFSILLLCIFILFVFYWLFVIKQNPFLLAYNLIRLVEFALLGLVIAKTFKKEDLPKIIKFLDWALFLQVGLAGYQVLTGGTFGLWLLGERSFSISTPGIARFIAPSGMQLLRGYGTFPHPNVFGGFCLFLLVTNSFLFLTHCHCEPRRGGARPSLFLGLLRLLRRSAPRNDKGADPKPLFLYLLGFTFGLLGIWLSFSVIAIVLSQVFLLSLMVVVFLKSVSRRIMVMFIKSFSVASSTVRGVLRQTQDTSEEEIGGTRCGSLARLPSFCPWLLTIFSLLIILITIYYLLFTFQSESLSRRLALLKISWNMFRSSPLFGIGLGNFIPWMPEEPIGKTYFWQPVHNVFVLVAVETGLVGLAIACLLIWNLLKISNIKYQISKIQIKNQKFSFLIPNYYLLITICCWLVILITGLFDHYWLTLQQGRLMLTLLVGLSFVKDLPR